MSIVCVIVCRSFFCFFSGGRSPLARALPVCGTSWGSWPLSAIGVARDAAPRALRPRPPRCRRSASANPPGPQYSLARLHALTLACISLHPPNKKNARDSNAKACVDLPRAEEHVAALNIEQIAAVNLNNWDSFKVTLSKLTTTSGSRSPSRPFHTSLCPWPRQRRQRPGVQRRQWEVN